MKDKISKRVAELVRKENGMIYADGVCIGRVTVIDAKAFLEVKDRDRLRCERMGRDFVLIPLSLFGIG